MQFLKKHCQLSWEIAVHNAKLIIDGLTDLTQRKLFVSSFQNALELCFKQILLDRNNHKVINKEKGMKTVLLFILAIVFPPKTVFSVLTVNVSIKNILSK